MKKPRTRADMTSYLRDHFRYDTMNGWNRSTSYANKIKVHTVVPREDQDAVYAMLEVQDSYDESGFNAILREFETRYNHSWLIGANGRNGGYLVLYQGGERPSQHKSQCRVCFQRNFDAVPQQVAGPPEVPGKCGRCGAMARYNRSFPPDTFTYPGKSTDMDEDFAEWSMYALKERVNLVWDFDKTCNLAVAAYIRYAKENHVVEEVVHVPKRVKVAVPNNSTDEP